MSRLQLTHKQCADALRTQGYARVFLGDWLSSDRTTSARIVYDKQRQSWGILYASRRAVAR